MAILRPYKGDEPFIFISYAHRDKGGVHKIIKNMLDNGYRVWYDEGIDPGTEWDDTIAEHVEGCGYFIAFISKNYLASENCMDELDYARDSNRKRLLVYLENVSLPGGMKMRLNRLQAIHKYKYESEEDFYEKLYTADKISEFKDEIAPPAPKKAPAKKSAKKSAPSYQKPEAAPEIIITPSRPSPAEEAKIRLREEWRELISSEATPPDYSDYKAPSADLLTQGEYMPEISNEQFDEVINALDDTLASFKIKATVSSYTLGPAVLRLEVVPEAGVSIRQLLNLQADISLLLSSFGFLLGSARITPIVGKLAVGIEIPLSATAKIPLRTLIEDKYFKNAKSPLTVCAGLDVTGEPVFTDIDRMPHLLISGMSGAGKSSFLSAMIMSIIYRASPDEVKLILMEPKGAEMGIFNKLPHLLMPVIKDPEMAVGALKWVTEEMYRRFDLLEKAGVRRRSEYYLHCKNNPDFVPMPSIVVIVDEYAHLLLRDKEQSEGYIGRISALARAAGIHLIISTQRSTVDVITGVIRANMPSRLAFRTATHLDSRIILDEGGAETLGRGEMLYKEAGGPLTRIKAPFAEYSDIKKAVACAVENNGEAVYNPEILRAVADFSLPKAQSDEPEDAENGIPLSQLCEAIELFIEKGTASTNLLQRTLRIGFNRAASIINELEKLGFISAQSGAKPRKVLVTEKEYLNWKKDYLDK